MAQYIDGMKSGSKIGAVVVTSLYFHYRNYCHSEIENFYIQLHWRKISQFQVGSQYLLIMMKSRKQIQKSFFLWSLSSNTYNIPRPQKELF